MKRDYATLRGLAAGDALGAAFETLTNRVDPRMASWRGELLDGGEALFWPNGRPAGGTTDDTAFATALARSLCRKGAYDLTDAGASYAPLLVVPGLGGTLRKALERLATGVSPEVSGVEIPDDADYCGSGAAMRIAPWGLFVATREGVSGLALDHCAWIARADACVTHACHEAEAGSLVVALGVQGLVDRSFAGVRWAIQDGLERASLAQTRVARAFRGEFTPNASGDVAHLIGAVWEDLTWAAIHQPGSHPVELVQKTLMRTVKRGGDTDTRAAILGAWLGTWFGADAFPPEWAAQVQGWSELEALDRQLANA